MFLVRREIQSRAVEVTRESRRESRRLWLAFFGISQANIDVTNENRQDPNEKILYFDLKENFTYVQTRPIASHVVDDLFIV